MITLTIINHALVRENNKWYRYQEGIVNYADHNIPQQIKQFTTQQQMLQYIEDNQIEIYEEQEE